MLSSESNCGYNYENRIFLECIYLLLNLGSVEALMRGISTSKQIRLVFINYKFYINCLTLNFSNHRLFKGSLKMCLDYFNCNFYRVLHNIQKLPHILAAIASLKLPHIRHKILQQFSVCYKTIPIGWTQQVLNYSHEKQLLLECKAYGIDVDVQAKLLKFVKGKFDGNSVVVNI